MNSKRDTAVENTGYAIGFILAHFVFTTVLYIMLSLLNRLGNTNYIELMTLSLVIVYSGYVLKRIFK